MIVEDVSLTVRNTEEYTILTIDAPCSVGSAVDLQHGAADSRCEQKIYGFYTVTLPSQSDGKPASSITA